MTTLLNSIHKTESKFDIAAEKFLFHHPFLGSLLTFIGMSIFILIIVTVCTIIIAFPLALIFGWL